MKKPALAPVSSGRLTGVIDTLSAGYGIVNRHQPGGFATIREPERAIVLELLVVWQILLASMFIAASMSFYRERIEAVGSR